MAAVLTFTVTILVATISQKRQHTSLCTSVLLPHMVQKTICLCSF